MAVGTMEPAKAGRKTKTKAKANAERASGQFWPTEPPLERPASAVGLFNLQDCDVTACRVDQFERHPANRVPTPAAVAAMAESIRSLGHIEPIIARRREGHERYQIVSGETRWLAHRQDGAVLIKARIIECSDASALALVAEANAKRTDLTTLERARLIRELCRPQEEGGGGLTRGEAAVVCGLESSSAASNLVRLLDAPEEWQALLETGVKWDGEVVAIHEATVREVAKYSACPELCEEIRKQWAREHWRAVRSRDDQVRHVARLVDLICRPLAGKRDYGWQLGEHRCLLDLTPELRRKLRVVTAPVGKGGRDVEVALNAKLWDELMAKEIQAQGLDRESRERSAKKASDKPGKKLSPKEQAAADAAKRKEQDEQLGRWSREWRYRLLRCEIAERIDPDGAEWILPWLLVYAVRDHRCPAESLVNYAVDSYWTDPDDRKDEPLIDTILRVAQDGSRSGSLAAHANREQALLRIAKLILWPADPHSREVSLVATGIPERLAFLPSEAIDAVAEHLEIDWHDAWQAGTVDSSPARALVAQLFSRHTSEQLNDLADDLGVTLTASGKAARVAELLSHHKAGAPLPLPKLLQEKRRKGGAK